MNQPDFPTYILPFNAISAGDLARVGGKGANLGEMARAGFPVPPGFCLTTAAFRRFIDACDAAALYAGLEAVGADDVDTARRIGEQVRQRLSALPVPEAVAEATLAAWEEAGSHHAYAVRSSATAEDLPEASFAGQQDTFLNVRGPEALLEAVRCCWISLFTDRAILYRARNGFSHREVALSVVVQRMVLPEVSGILFTADPITGARQTITIDASYGLGEALVAGLVTPDHYKVDKGSLQVIDVRVADKQVAIRPLAEGGTIQETLSGKQRTERVLPEAQAILLAEIGRRIEGHYGRPQDIEWAIENGRIYILQSRPITSLYPLPAAIEAQPDSPLRLMFSFGAVQGMLDPMTPLGQDTIRGAFAGAARVFGYRLSAETQQAIWTAGERLFVNVTPLLNNQIGHKVLRNVFPLLEPGAAQAIVALLSDPRLAPTRRWPRPATLWRIGRVFLPVFGRLLRALRRPDASREQLQRRIEAFVADFETQNAAATTLAARVARFDALLQAIFPTFITRLIPVIAAGLAPLNLLNRLAASLPGRDHNVLALTRGLPHNVTTEMDLALWQTARAIQDDSAAATHFEQTEAAALADEFLAGRLPAAAQTAVATFLRHYGTRGLAEIDLGRPRWREDPTPVMQVLQSYLHIDDPNLAPDAVFGRGAAAAEAAVETLAQALSGTPGGWFKARLARATAHRLRALAGLRETPKFLIIRLLGMVRAGLLASGRELVEAGVLGQPDDLFFLHLAELKALAAGQKRDWQALVAERRHSYAREQQRRQIPRLLLSDGRAFYEGVSAPAGSDGNTLIGSPVSPGVVEGRVHVILNPHGARLAPGEILVCPGTDPAWTPLFLAAGGLVMEVGGLMTHGSVVAREYGIPAVVGVDQATTRLQTGQRVRVHGDQGTVEILDN